MKRNTYAKRRFAPRGARPAQDSIGIWDRPPKDPPQIVENKWRFAKLKISGAAATDAGAISDLTGTNLTDILKTQQGVNSAGSFINFRVLRISSYAAQGVAVGGEQVFPTVKIRAYAPEPIAQGILLDQREDQGTLEDIARLRYTYRMPYRNMVINGASTNYFAQIEYYHAPRMFTFVDVKWATQPN